MEQAATYGNYEAYTPKYGVEQGPQIVPIAGVGQRFVASFIDGILFSILSLLVYAVVFGPLFLMHKVPSMAQITASQMKYNPQANPLAGVISPQLLLLLQGLILVVTILYYAGFIAEGGQTPGKMMLGLRVVRTNGRPVGWGRAFLRWIGYYISSIPFGLGYLWALWDPKRQAWHDKIAGTVVIYAKAPYNPDEPFAFQLASSTGSFVLIVLVLVVVPLLICTAIALINPPIGDILNSLGAGRFLTR